MMGSECIEYLSIALFTGYFKQEWKLPETLIPTGNLFHAVKKCRRII